MTLIAFTTSTTKADILTDTSRYTRDVTYTGRGTKVHHIAHLDMAYATQGDCRMADYWASAASGIAADAVDFDEFVTVAEGALPDLWQQAVVDKVPDPDAVEFVAFLIGYSPHAGRFTAYQLAADYGFEAQRLDAPFMIPSLQQWRIPDMEYGRLTRDIESRDEPLVNTREALRRWRRQPPMPAPLTPQDWVELGKAARTQRGLGGGVVGVIIDGDLFHTTLRQGEYTSRRVHRFDNTGPEFMRMVSNTLHPLGQLGPCVCGSGKRSIDCHLVASLAEPCPCGSGELFADCHSVLAEPKPLQIHVTEVV